MPATLVHLDFLSKTKKNIQNSYVSKICIYTTFYTPCGSYETC